MAPRTLCWLVLFGLVACLGLRTQRMLHPVDPESLYREEAVYQYVRNQIHDKYVDEVDERKLFYGALSGMTATLDAHSAFLPPEKYEELRAATDGSFEGVGIEFDDSDGLRVRTPLAGSPAFYGGVLAGDRILKIDGVTTAGLSVEAARARMKGRLGTPVRLTVRHAGSQTPVEITLTRSTVETKSIQAAEVLDARWAPAGTPPVGYVQLEHFQRNTAADLDAALGELDRQGIKGLILDLRQNPGGALEAAEGVADLFLEDGLIVSLISRTAPQEDKFVHNAGTCRTYPLVVLVDGHSASASEIVAGALKDRERAVLVGERTFGKFSVQNVIPFNLDGGAAALKLTTARYKTPKSECLDGQGLMPDYPVAFSSAQLRAFREDRFRRYIQSNDPRISAGSGLAGSAFVDEQLKKAVEVLAEQLRTGQWPVSQAAAGEPTPGKM